MKLLLFSIVAIVAIVLGWNFLFLDEDSSIDPIGHTIKNEKDTVRRSTTTSSPGRKLGIAEGDSISEQASIVAGTSEAKLENLKSGISGAVEFQKLDVGILSHAHMKFNPVLMGTPNREIHELLLRGEQVDFRGGDKSYEIDLSPGAYAIGIFVGKVLVTESVVVEVHQKERTIHNFTIEDLPSGAFWRVKISVPAETQFAATPTSAVESIQIIGNQSRASSTFIIGSDSEILIPNLRKLQPITQEKIRLAIVAKNLGVKTVQVSNEDVSYLCEFAAPSEGGVQIFGISDADLPRCKLAMRLPPEHSWWLPHVQRDSLNAWKFRGIQPGVVFLDVQAGGRKLWTQEFLLQSGFNDLEIIVPEKHQLTVTTNKGSVFEGKAPDVKLFPVQGTGPFVVTAPTTFEAGVYRFSDIAAGDYAIVIRKGKTVKVMKINVPSQLNVDFAGNDANAWLLHKENKKGSLATKLRMSTTPHLWIGVGGNRFANTAESESAVGDLLWNKKSINMLLEAGGREFSIKAQVKRDFGELGVRFVPFFAP